MKYLNPQNLLQVGHTSQSSVKRSLLGVSELGFRKTVDSNIPTIRPRIICVGLIFVNILEFESDISEDMLH